MEDEKILDLYFARNQRAITETQDKYGKYCGVIAGNILHNREDEEECVNETWFSAWNAIPPKRPERFAAFLGKITRNLALNLYEKYNAAKRGGDRTGECLEELHEVLPDEHNVMEEVVDDIALGRIINSFLGTLNEKSRKVFVQRYFYMRTTEEIAEDLSMTESGVRMSLLRTRQRLKDCLFKEGITL